MLGFLIVLLMLSCQKESEPTDLIVELDNLIYEDPTRAMPRIDSSYQILKNGDPGDLSDLLRIKGTCYWIQGELDTAAIYLKKSSDLAIDNNLKKRYNKAQMNYALVRATQGKYDQAKATLEGLKFYSIANRDTTNLSRIYINIGEINRREGDFIGALENNLKALELNTLTGNKENTAHIYNNISISNKNLFQFEKALEAQEKELIIFSEMNNNNGVVKILNNIGLNLLELNRTSEAIDYFEKALTLKRKLGNKLSVCQTMHNLAMAYCKLDDLDKSKLYLDSTSVDILELGTDNNKFNYYNLKSQLCLKKGKHKEFATLSELANEYLDQGVSKDQFGFKILQLKQAHATNSDNKVETIINDLDSLYAAHIGEQFKSLLNIDTYINKFADKERELNLSIENEKLTNRMYLGLLIGLTSLLIFMLAFRIFAKRRNKEIDQLQSQRDQLETSLLKLSTINKSRQLQEKFIILDEKEGYQIKAGEIAYIKATQGTIEFYNIDNDLIIRIHKTLAKFLSESDQSKAFVRISKFYALNKSNISGVSKSTIRVGSQIELAWSEKYLNISELEY